MLIACIFESCADVIGDESLGNSIERQLHAGAFEFNHACIIIEMLSAGARECCLNLASARPFGGIWGLFKMLRIGLPQGLDGRVEQPLAKAVCLLDCLEQCLPFWGELMEPSLAIELTELGMWVVETEDLF